MKPVLLIAANFLREQRLITGLLVFYAIGGAALFSYGETRVPIDDLAFFLRQQSFYSVLFSAFLATSAIHNERKSRRILAVLSKAVCRRQYLAGLLCGVTLVFAIYCVAIGVGGMWLMRHSGLHPLRLWMLLCATALASLLAATVTLFFSTFLHPLLAPGAAALVAALPLILGKLLGPGWSVFLPVVALANMLNKSTLLGSGVAWWPLITASLEVIVFWLAASWIFSRRDIAVAVE